MKNIYLNCTLILFFIAVSDYAYTQNTIPATLAIGNSYSKQNEQAGVKAAHGTYQFIRLSKIEEVFTVEHMNELLFKIENNRQVNEEKLLTISEYTQVRILAKNTISAPDFTPVEEFVISTIK